MMRQMDMDNIISTSLSSNLSLDGSLCFISDNHSKDFLSYQLATDELQVSTDTKRRVERLAFYSGRHIWIQSVFPGCVIKQSCYFGLPDF